MNILSNNPQENIAGLSGSPKTMFILGLSVGVGAMAVLALIFTMTMFMQGTGVVASGGDTSGTQVAAANPTAADPAGETAPAPPAAPVPDVTDADHIRGNSDAKVTLIEYSDFECSFCSRHLETIDQIMDEYPNDVRLVYRHFPLSFHQFAGPSAEASECAAVQGKFWEMHDGLFAAANGVGLSTEGITQIATDIGLNTSDFDSCMTNGDMVDAVGADYQDGIASGVGGTPGTFVNGELVEGAVPYETFKQIIEAAGAQS
jgi:protein-disulfide isomerase